MTLSTWQQLAEWKGNTLSPLSTQVKSPENLECQSERSPNRLNEMNIIVNRQPSADELPDGVQAEIYLLGIEVDNVHDFAKEMVSIVSDTNWIQKLNPLGKASYEATAIRTIAALVQIFNTSNGQISKDFGEFMVSLSASRTLGNELGHNSFPLSEIWKEKLTGNHGFDYYTECPEELINCGEAKFNSTNNAYGAAARQVCEFIDDEKDLGDLVHLNYFSSEVAVDKLVSNRERGFCLAFSVNSHNLERILVNSLANSDVIRLSKEAIALYIIGIKT